MANQIHIPVVQYLVDSSTTETVNLFLLTSGNQDIKNIATPLFQGVHSSEVTESQPPLPFIERTEISNGFFFFSFIIILLFWAFYYQKHHKGLLSILNSFFNDNTLFQELNDKSGANGIVSLGMFLLGIANLSMFSYHVILEYVPSVFFMDFQKTGFTILFISFAIIIGLFTKTLFILTSGFIFNSPKNVQGYLTLVITSIQVLGVILFPFTVLLVFGDSISPSWILKLGMVLTSIIFSYRLIRSFLLGVKQTNTQVFHIILYICALEILPLFVFGRLIYPYI